MKTKVLLFPMFLGILSIILLWSVDWRVFVGVFLWQWGLGYKELMFKQKEKEELKELSKIFHEK